MEGAFNMEEKIQKHKDAFKNDPIYKNISERKLEDLIFDDEEYFNSISFTEGYATKRTAQLIGVTDKVYKITNLLARDSLKDYFGVYKKDNTFYRYTWESVFKLKMVIRLMDHENLTPSDITDIIDIPTLVREETLNESEYKRAGSGNERFPLSNGLDSKEILMAAQQFSLILAQRNTLETALSSLQNEMKTIEVELDNLSENKSYLDLLMLKEKADAAGRTKNKGFFDFLKGSNSQVKESGESEVTVALKERIEKLETKEVKLNDQKSDVEDKLKAAQHDLNSIQDYISSNHSLALSKAAQVLKIETDNSKEDESDEYSQNV